jgi:uncharacterized membrane protein YphA (DoxX/SURF4 family)
MNKMAVIAAILLAAALIFPMYMLIESSNEDFRDLMHRGFPLDETQIDAYFQDATVRHQTLFAILAVGELVLVVLFVIALRASLKL